MAQRIMDELVPVPRSAVRFPLELHKPEGFVPTDPGTWPLIEGQLEYVDGKLLFMPPSADRQQDTTADVVTVLGIWRRSHREFIVAGNEAGMILGGETRGADAAIWRKEQVAGYEGKYRREPPILAVEVQGELEDERMLRDKARWYVTRGVTLVWLLFPTERRVLVIDANGEETFTGTERLRPNDALPDLAPFVSELFAQIAER